MTTISRRAAHPGVLVAVLCAATFMSSLDLFIVNVALRAIGSAFGETSLANLSWVLNGYAIVFAALLVPAGRLADRYGVKEAFLAGLALFSLASLGCALSSALWPIIVFRALQAIGAAALVPTSLGLILTAIPEHRRQLSIQLWGVSGSLGAAAGPALGGLLTQISWRWIFVVNLPIGLAAFVAAALVAPRLRHQVETRLPDVLGGALLMVAVGALSLALIEAPSWGWASFSTIASFAVAAVGLPLFVARSARHPAPVVDLHLFRSPAFRWANASMLFLSVAFSMQLLGLPLLLRGGWGLSPILTGLAIAPGPVMVSVGALGLRRFTSRLPAGFVAAVGLVLIGAGGILVGASITATPHYAAAVLPGWLVIGLGAGFSFPTIYSAATVDVEQRQAATASAVIQMSRQIGAVLGVAALVLVLGACTLSREAASTVSAMRGGWLACSRPSRPSPLVASVTAKRRLPRRRRRLVSPTGPWPNDRYHVSRHGTGLTSRQLHETENLTCQGTPTTGREEKPQTRLTPCVALRVWTSRSGYAGRRSPLGPGSLWPVC
jgi:EmrB/QacA subfamily drug resistance transporter